MKWTDGGNNLNVELNKKEAQHILTALIRTNAHGKDLDVSEELEGILLKFIKNDK